VAEGASAASLPPQEVTIDRHQQISKALTLIHEASDTMLRRCAAI
jgi:hypothetical protein